MGSFRKWRSRFLGTIHARRGDQDLEHELQMHLELVARNAQGRRNANDAMRTVRVAAGGVSQAMDAVRDQRGLPWLDDLKRDVRYAVRRLAGRPGFSAVVVLTLALGIGLTTAIFSVVYGVLLQPLPYARADRIVAVAELSSRGWLTTLADPNFDDFRRQNRSFQALAKYTGTVMTTVSGASPPMRARITRVSPDFLTVFGVQPTGIQPHRKGPAPRAARRR